MLLSYREKKKMLILLTNLLRNRKGSSGEMRLKLNLQIMNLARD